MDLHRELIQSVVFRCRVSSLRETLLRWGRISDGQLNRVLRGSKREVAERIIEFVKENSLSDEIVGDLELSYMQLHSRSKVWVVYKLVGNELCLHLDPRTLRSKVLHNLQLKWLDGHVFGNMKLFNGAVWLRMNLGPRLVRGATGNKKYYNHNNSVFIIAFPKSPFVFINKTNVRLLRVVTEAVKQAMNAESMKDIKLTGCHVTSLADIVLKKDRTLSKYRDKEDSENPLLEKRERKRKAKEDCFSDTEDMQDEDRSVKQMRRDILEKRFGSEPQPVLETLQYKFNLKFHGKPDNDECKSLVEVKGTSVLDGLYQVVSKGLAKFPLPRHLTTVTTSARNSFDIESGKKV